MYIYAIHTFRFENEESEDVTTISSYWGFFMSKEEAVAVIKSNAGDIFENYYDYATVTKLAAGLQAINEPEYIEWYVRDWESSTVQECDPMINDRLIMEMDWDCLND